MSEHESVTDRAAQALKGAPALLVRTLEAMMQMTRAAQRVYEQAVDGALGTQTGAEPRPAQPNVAETLSGLIAFVVPGPDPFSVAQGVSTIGPGGLAAGVLPLLIDTLNGTLPSLPGGPPASVFAAGGLDALAQRVNASAQGPFSSPFANLAFAEKGRVFEIIEGDAQLRPLAAVLPLVAFLTYSEAPVFDPRTRTLRGDPPGWSLSAYPGVADGRADFKGYFEDRTHVETSADYAWR